MNEEKILKCPLCKLDSLLDEFDEEGDIIICRNCDAELELESLDPPKARALEYEDFEDDYIEDDFNDYDDEGDDI
ncbi:hypothetical protein ACFLR5_00460 [Elusimicrobiota bacterium]